MNHKANAMEALARSDLHAAMSLKSAASAIEGFSRNSMDVTQLRPDERKSIVKILTGLAAILDNNSMSVEILSEMMP